MNQFFFYCSKPHFELKLGSDMIVLLVLDWY